MEGHRSTVIILIGLICLSAAFSASETALTAANKIRLKNQAEDGDKNAEGAMKLIEKYDSTLSALLISNNIVNTLSAALTTVLFTALFSQGAVGIATAVITVVIVIFGEVLPKSFANENAEKFIKIMQKPLHIIIFVFTPAIKFLEILKKAIIRKDGEEETPSVTERELMSIIDEIEGEGVLEEDEADLVQNAIEFNDIEVGEIITPRVDICAVEKHEDKKSIMEMFLENNYSRIPVYEGSIDKIIGFINQKDFYAAILRGVEFSIESLIKPCLYVPPKKKIIDIMHSLQKNTMHMAIVTDEYGGTLGMVTLEDILEQLVGEIWDEHDEETQLVYKVDDVTYDVLSEISMSDLYEELLNTKKSNVKDYSTLSGYLMEKMNKIPDEGDSYQDAYLRYTIKEADDNRIKIVKVSILQPEDFEV